jgi:serine/threonine-protein kinase
MAPEQILGEESGPVMDVYAFACVAYELLSGRKLFEARSMAQLLQDKLAMNLPPARDIGPRGITLEMHGLLIAGLQKDPDKRLGTLREVAAWGGEPSEGFLRALFPA